MEWMDLAQDRNCWLVFVNAVMNFQFPKFREFID